MNKKRVSFFPSLYSAMPQRTFYQCCYDNNFLVENKVDEKKFKLQTLTFLHLR